MSEVQDLKKEIDMENNIYSIEIDFNEKTRLGIMDLINRRNAINAQIESTISTYLDAKDIEPNGKQIEFNSDYTKLKITSK
jgi:hypothetical protein